MSDDDLIRRGDALQLVEEYETIHDRISLLPAALPARGVGAKPLQWRDGYRPAASPELYQIWPDNGASGAPDDPLENFDGFMLYSPHMMALGVYPTIDAAKAAAQADYEARILDALAPTDAAEVEAHDEQLGVWADELMADLVLNGLMDLVNHDYDTKVGARREIIAALEMANQARAPQIAPTDAAHAPFRIEDMTLADLMRDPLYEEATTPATDAAQAREAALREAAQLVDDLGQETVARIILALIGERT